MRKHWTQTRKGREIMKRNAEKSHRAHRRNSRAKRAEQKLALDKATVRRYKREAQRALRATLAERGRKVTYVRKSAR